MSDNPKFQAIRGAIADAEQKQGRVLRLSDARKVDRLGGLDIPWPLFDQKKEAGEIIQIEVAIDAEIHAIERGESPAGDKDFETG